MKLLRLISAVAALAPVALAGPVIIERQTTPVEAISNSVSLLQSDVNQNSQAIVGAVTNAENNVNAAVSVAASVSANLEAIAEGFKNAAAAIVAQVAQTAAGVESQVEALTQSEIDALIADLGTLQQIIEGISATITFEVTNLLPVAQATVSTEVNVLLAVIAPVVNPVMIFADAVLGVQAKLTVVVTGVQGAYDGVNTVVQRLAATNGLPGVDFPGYPA